VRDELERVVVPGADKAGERAHRVVLAAFAAREPVPRPHRTRRIAVGVALAAVVVGLAAMSPPGMAVVDRVREAVGVERAAPALFSLHGGGRLLVTSDDGLWVVEANGKKRRLAPYGAASWSPFGRFVVATRGGTELVALEPDGAVRWTLARRGVHSAVWGGTRTDTRIAYIDRTGLRVVAGDGTGDRLLAPAEEGPLAWRPGGGHQLAYVSGSEVRVQQTDTGRVLWRANRGPVERVRALVWSDDGGRLLVLSTHALSVFDGAGRELVHVEPDGVGRYTDATFVPGTQRVVVLLNGTDVVLRDTGQTLFRGSGLAGVTPSPDGRWLLVTWPRADQWVFVGPGGRLRAVAGITEQFRSRSGFPRVEGWCCS
jgi:hypothetical protein